MRPVRAVLLISLGLGLTACGGQGSTAESPSAGAGGSATGATEEQSSGAGNGGIQVHEQDYTYEVRAVSPLEVVDHVTVDYGSISHVAPAGMEFVTVTIAITNPGSTPEALPIEASCCNSLFQFGTPQSSSADTCPLTLTADICWIVAEVATVDPPHQFEMTPEIPAGGTVTIELTTLDPLPDSTTLSDLGLYFTHPLDGSAPDRIPVPSS
jgi:hypothetical protein